VKYCLSARQPKNILKKADEIKIELRDFKAIPDYIDNFPDKTLILEMENELPEKFSWNTIEVYSKKHSDFYCCAANYHQMNECKNRNIKFYYKYSISSFYELSALKELGVSYVLIGVPLIFDLKNVSRYEIPVRVIPNLAYEPYLKHENGICGGWIRPEDISNYETYVSVCEFYAPKMLEKEATLYHVYAENKAWPGNLNLLIDNLNVDVNNKAILDEEDFAEKRMNCKHRCMSTGTCHYCFNQIQFINTIYKYREQKNKN
jgi:hypothetical protein